MSKNCFVKKLKGVVSNSDLPVYDGINIKVLKASVTPNDSALSLRIISSGEITIKTDDSHLFYVNGGSGVSEYSGVFQDWAVIKAQNENYNIIIKSKKLVTDFSNVDGDTSREHNYGFDINALENCTGTINVRSNSNVYGEVKRIKASSFSISNSPNTFINFANVVFDEAITWFGQLAINKTDSKGDFNNASLIRMLASTTNSGEVKLNFENTSVVGNPVNFANALVAAGKNKGKIKMYTTGTTITNPTGINTFLIRFGTSMENPTAEETSQGYQFASV